VEEIVLRRSAGFTVVELMLTLAILGIVATISFPKMRNATALAAVRSTKQALAERVTVARAAAIRRNRTAKFVRVGNTTKVVVDSAGTLVTLDAARDAYAISGVTLSGVVDTITFDPRGMAVGLTAAKTIVVTRASLRDSICIDVLGKVSSGACS
jgi:type IV fimbrial biogenesis protein FimT